MTDRSGPADTRMMGIVHDALRRDLARALSLLPEPLPGPRHVAIARHVEWMMQFLHRHHRGEDAGLWPIVRRRDPELASLVDTMEADHRDVAPLVSSTAAAAREHGSGATTATAAALAGAIERLSAVLLPHLEREEDAMTRVSVAVTESEWRAIDREHFLAGRSLPELAFEGHWLLDGLSAERAAVVVHQVGPIARPVLVHGFARTYHRRAVACWGEAGAGAYRPTDGLPHHIPPAGRTAVIVDAAPAAVWTVVADVTRVPEWSRECRRIDWLDGAGAPVPGVRFRGENRAGPLRWRRTNEVVAAEAPRRLVWRTVPTLLYPDSTEWRIELEPAGTGTRVVLSYEILRVPRVLSFLYSLLVPSHRERSSELGDDLRRLGRVAGSAPAEGRRLARSSRLP